MMNGWKFNNVTYAFLKIINISFIFICILWNFPGYAGNNPESATDEKTFLPLSWQRSIESEWGGRLKISGEASWPDDNTLLQPDGKTAFYDGYLNLRVKNKTFFSDQAYFTTHYEIGFFRGDTHRKIREAQLLYSGLSDGFFLHGTSETDERRFFDLTKTVSTNNEQTLYHRLDRLSVTFQPDWGTLRIGRQALTWGNGLLFNPMDFFNPFSPTQIDREYKSGDDMVSVLFNNIQRGDLQFIYVPRRNPANGNLEFDQTSLAVKLHRAVGTTEFDIMGARHYSDTIIGLGTRGYLGDAGWRMDSTYTFFKNGTRKSGFLSIVADMDYAWTWWNKNVYGFIEVYFNGLGVDDYPSVFSDSNMMDRLSRGEMFTVGRKYAVGQIQVELHPLFNFYFTLINNMSDPSGIIQPRGVWDMKQDYQLTFGANIYYGSEDTEFGGFKIPQTDIITKPSDTMYIWLTCFF